MWSSFNGSKMKPSVCDVKTCWIKGNKRWPTKIIITTQAIIFIRTLAQWVYVRYTHATPMPRTISIPHRMHPHEWGRHRENVVDPVAHNATQPLQTDKCDAIDYVVFVPQQSFASFSLHMDVCVRAALPQTLSTSLYKTNLFTFFSYTQLMMMVVVVRRQCRCRGCCCRYTDATYRVFAVAACSCVVYDYMTIWTYVCISLSHEFFRVFETKSVGQNYLNATDVKRRKSSKTSSSCQFERLVFDASWFHVNLLTNTKIFILREQKENFEWKKKNSLWINRRKKKMKFVSVSVRKCECGVNISR